VRASATFDVHVSQDRVVAYLSNPRHLLIANNDGPVVAASDPPVRTGSWSLLAFDQLRVRVEYTAFEPPELIATSVIYSGRGSRGMQGVFVYRLRPAPDREATTVRLEAESTGGWTPGLLSRLLWPLMWRGLRDRMSRATTAR
jgi:hypothetical protein